MTFPSPDHKIVYVVDDDLPLRELYATLLTSIGCQVTTFGSGEEALAQMPNLPIPNLLILDFSLHPMSGESFARTLSEAHPNLRQKLLVAGFSNHQVDSPVVQEFKKLVDVYFEKPSDIETLTQCVSKLLSGPKPPS